MSSPSHQEEITPSRKVEFSPALEDHEKDAFVDNNNDNSTSPNKASSSIKKKKKKIKQEITPSSPSPVKNSDAVNNNNSNDLLATPPPREEEENNNKQPQIVITTATETAGNTSTAGGEEQKEDEKEDEKETKKDDDDEKTAKSSDEKTDDDRDSFLKTFPEETEREQLDSFRDFYFDLSCRADYLHHFLQASLLIPSEKTIRHMHPSPSRSYSTMMFGPSPLRQQVLDPANRLSYDFWLQEEKEFTQLCFFKLEDVKRSGILKTERERFTIFVTTTIQLKLRELQMDEIEKRDEILVEADLNFLEVLAISDFSLLDCQRSEWIMKLSGTKVYLRVWPSCFDQKRNFAEVEDEQFKKIIFGQRHEAMTIKRAPHARIWVVASGDAPSIFASSATEEEEKVVKKHISETKQNVFDVENEKEQEDVFAVVGAVEQLISTPRKSYDNNNNEDDDINNTAASDANRSRRSSRRSSLAEIELLNSPDFKRTQQKLQQEDLKHPSQNISIRHLDFYYEQQFRLSSQRIELTSLEHRFRVALLKEENEESTQSLFQNLICEQEHVLRVVLAFDAKEYLQELRQEAQDSLDRAKIVDGEWRYRIKWQAIESAHRNELMFYENKDWVTCINEMRVVYHLAGAMEGRLARAAVLRQAGHVIWLFMKQRREVLRVTNMRKNLAKFLQRCGRGFVVRKRCCLDRLHMLRVRADSLFRLKCRLSLLLSREVRSRFSRGQIIGIQQSTAISQFMRWRSSCLFVRSVYNNMLCNPHLRIILGNIAFNLSWRKTDALRRNHSSRVLQRSMRSHHIKQTTMLAAKFILRNLFYRKSALITQSKRTSHSLKILHLFSKISSSLQIEAKRLMLIRLRVACMIQRVGRGSLIRHYDLKPAHLYNVQEVLYATFHLVKWYRAMKVRQIIYGKYVKNYLLKNKKLKIESEENYLDRDVPNRAQIIISKWWRMTCCRRKYCAWKISNCFLKRRVRCHFAFLKKIYSKTKTGFVEEICCYSEGSRHDDQLELCRRREELMKISSFFSEENSNDNNNNNHSDSDYYVVGQQEEDKNNNNNNLNSSSSSAALSNEVAHFLLLSFLQIQASITQECVSSYQNLEIMYRYDRHVASFKKLERNLKNLQREQEAVRFRIETQRLNWIVSITRFKNFCHGDFRYYFIPFEKQDETAAAIEEEKKIATSSRTNNNINTNNSLHLPKNSVLLLLPSETAPFSKKARDLLKKQERKRLRELYGKYAPKEAWENFGQEVGDFSDQEDENGNNNNAVVSVSVSDRLREARRRRRSSGILVTMSTSDSSIIKTSTLLFEPPDNNNNKKEEQEQEKQKEKQLDAQFAKKMNQPHILETLPMSSTTKTRRPLSAILLPSQTSTAAAATILQHNQMKTLEDEKDQKEEEQNKILPPKEWLKTRRRSSSINISSAAATATTNFEAAAATPTTTTPISYYEPHSSIPRSILEKRKYIDRSTLYDASTLSQMSPEKLLPPAGKYFDFFTGVFDVCRWWGNQLLLLERKSSSSSSSSSPDSSPLSPPSPITTTIGQTRTKKKPRTSPFGNASLQDLCDELSKSKPIEVLAMSSPWFPLNNIAISAIMYSALEQNKKNLRKVIVSNADDQAFVSRMVRRENLKEQVEVVVE